MFGQASFPDDFDGGAAVLPPRWLAIGPDIERQVALTHALARFGVDAVPGEAGAIGQAGDCPHLPVLCDARDRPAVQMLLTAVPRRVAPVLLTGVNSPQSRARYILAGADDAVSSRGATVEVAARMKAAWRARVEALGIIPLAGLVFDTGLRQVRWQGTSLPMMPREFDLLLALARHAGQTLRRDALLRAVWQTEFDPGTNSLEVHVFKLRGRLAVLGGAVRIETVKGQGYRLVTMPRSQG